jgi:hypothetical protein
MKLTLALTLLSAISATHARVNVFYSDGKQSFPELDQQDNIDPQTWTAQNLAPNTAWVTMAVVITRE